MEIVLWFFGIIIVFIAVLELVKKSADKKAVQAEAEDRGDNKNEDRAKFGFIEYFGLFSIIIVVYFLLFSGSSAEHQEQVKQEQQEVHILNVTDFPYTMRDKQAVSISIGQNKDNYYDITLLRDEIKEGATLERPLPALADSEYEYQTRVVNAGATLGNKKYFFIRKDEKASQTRVTFNSINKKQKEADISLYLKLYEADNPNYIEFGKQHIKIAGENFDNLINPPKKRK